jgi:putative nucleotidyltransferase with HDIG domain
MKKLLFVDQEPEFQTRLRHAVAHVLNEWDITYASSSDTALDALATASFDVIAAAQRLTPLVGVQLLEEVRKRSPETVRILMAEPSERRLLPRGINSVHQFLSSPCRPGDILAAATRAYDLRRLLAKPSVRKLLSGLRTLPSLPSLYLELEAELRSPDASLKSAAAIIASDPSMSAKTLQVINSPFFGLRKEVRDLVQAVTLLGLDAIKGLVLSVQVFSQYRDLPSTGFSVDSLWTHSLRTATLARKLARLEGCPDAEAETAFLGGLLHDIGILALIANLRDEYAALLRHSEAIGITATEGERRMFGATHAEVGAYLLGLWGLGDDLVEILAYHHTPAGHHATGFNPLTAVHVANALEYEAGARRAAWASGALDEGYLDQLRLLHRLPAWREIAGEMFISKDLAPA